MTESTVNTLALANSISLPELLKTLKAIIQTQNNGYIKLKTSTREEWWIDFRVGQLIWGGGGQHRFRRWQRLLQSHCPSLQPSEVRLREDGMFEHWEYVALSVLLKRQQLDRDIATSIIEATISEVLFDICQAVDNIIQISHSTNRQSRITHPITLLNSTTLLYNAKIELERWQKKRFSTIPLNLAPTIIDSVRLQKQTQPRTYQILKRLIHGNRSLRELSRITGRDLLELGSMVAAYVERGIISLKTIDDLPQPYSVMRQKVPSQVAHKLPLIFCIDDSPQVGYLMEEALRPEGYRCTSIQDSVQALAEIIRHKPNLIFLDMTMPVVNGYEICKQVRRVKAFSQTPIIMLTSNDSLMDRMRAKSVGATDFMVKPIDPTKILETVQSQLAQLHDKI